MCGNTIKTQTEYPASCTQACGGNSAQCCGDVSATYYSVYSISKLIFL